LKFQHVKMEFQGHEVFPRDVSRHEQPFVRAVCALLLMLFRVNHFIGFRNTPEIAFIYD
jgi:hypothetical protein